MVYVQTINGMKCLIIFVYVYFACDWIYIDEYSFKTTYCTVERKRKITILSLFDRACRFMDCCIFWDLITKLVMRLRWKWRRKKSLS